jgi:hypothetical protein
MLGRTRYGVANRISHRLQLVRHPASQQSRVIDNKQQQPVTSIEPRISTAFDHKQHTGQSIIATLLAVIIFDEY